MVHTNKMHYKTSLYEVMSLIMCFVCHYKLLTGITYKISFYKMFLRGTLQHLLIIPNNYNPPNYLIPTEMNS